MPIYDYECSDCGVFTEMRPMSESSAPSVCPECGQDAHRVFLRVPNFALMDGASRIAHSTNERAAHAPKSSKSGGHGPGCSCCSGSAKPSRTLHRADGSKSFPTARPWMISH